jgi:hypothetical protein
LLVPQNQALKTIARIMIKVEIVRNQNGPIPDQISVTVSLEPSVGDVAAVGS